MKQEFLLPRIAVTIRPALPSDVERLTWSVGRNIQARHEYALERQNRGELLFFVAVVNDYPVGHALLVWEGRPSALDYPDIQDIQVFEPFRGFGIGSALVAMCEAQCRARGIEQVGLAVGVENARARALYERLGYRVVGVAPYVDVVDRWTDRNGREHRATEHVINMAKRLVEHNRNG